ncbi:zinc-ribbon domain-containing protein [Amycolatopsis sp. NPDC004079]|uniref:zinc-ribbon domain-containing protein n=1 Tax=Amycolatopsis sp. NPDC004079 TaxID=3154549 RepID=UPI0033BCC798
MRMKPEQSLAAVHPDVAATWDPDHNGVHTPHNTSAKNSLRAWWRCPAGHRWSETVAARTGMPAWKRNDRAACRVCVGHSVITSFACGHVVTVEARFARPERDCPACRRAAWEKKQEQVSDQREAARAAYAGTGDEAQRILAEIEVPESVPAPLVASWRSTSLARIRRALVAEREFGKTGAAGTARREAATLLGQVPPTADQVRAAIEAREPVMVLGKAYWPPGWLRILGHDTAPPGEDPAVVAALRGWLQHAFAATAERCDTKTGTGILTRLVLDFADAQPRRFRHHRWIGYRELGIPITPGSAARYGRLDIVITRPHGPDLVIEIDSAHNPASVEKLRFAHAAGGMPLWIRWRSGPLPDTGIATIDLRE